MIRSLVLTLAMAGGLIARDAWSGPQPPDIVLDQRYVAGISGVSDLSLGVLAAGARWRTTPTLDLQASALWLRTAGTVLGAPANGGGGGEVAMRIGPWAHARQTDVRPYLGVGLGLVLFPRAPFLPGGDAYEGIITFSAGADVRLSEHLTTGARASTVHLSNGQGLGPHNPAYDGYGGAIELAWSPADSAPPNDAASDRTALRTGRASETPGVMIDAELGRAGDATLAAARIRAVQRVTRHTIVLLDGEGGSLGGSTVGEIGGALAVHLGVASVAAQAGYRGFAGGGIGLFTAQAEGHLDRAVSLVAMGHHERSAAFGSLWRAAVGGRAFATADLAVDIGVGFDRIGDDRVFGGDTSDPYLAVEYRLPWRPAGLPVALFVERQVSTLDIVGLRFGHDAGDSLRDFSRHDGWRRLR